VTVGGGLAATAPALGLRVGGGALLSRRLSGTLGDRLMRLIPRSGLRKPNLPKCRRVLPGVIVTVLGVVPPASAQSSLPSFFTWSGANNNWAAVNNWSYIDPVSGNFKLGNPSPINSDNALTFNGPNSPNAMVQDYSPSFHLNSMKFLYGSYSLVSGQNDASLIFHTSSQAVPAQIEVNSNSQATFATTVNLVNSLSVTGVGTLALNGPILGSGTLTMAGGSTLSLGGSNSYTGGTVVTNGRLAISADANLGAVPMFATSNVSISGAVLSVTVGFALNSNRTIVIGPAAATIDVEASQTFVVAGQNQLQIGSAGLVKTGLGTLVVGNSSINGVTVSAGTLQCADANATGTIVDNGNVAFNQAAPASYAGGLSGTGTFTKVGPGTLTLTGDNSYHGGTFISGGTLSFSADSQLGAAEGSVTVNNGAAVLFNGLMPGPARTARTLNINNGNFTVATEADLTFDGAIVNLTTGSLSVAAGGTLTYAGAAVYGGFLRGSGTHIVTGGTTFSGVTTFNSTVVNQTGAGSFVNFSNGGAICVSSGGTGTPEFSGFVNQGSGSITVGAASQVNAADFQTYGLLTLVPAASDSGQQKTRLTNAGTTPLYFNGGSRTFIGTPQTAGLNLALVDLNGQNAIVAGGLFINNGFVGDSTGSGATIVADFGSLVKGAGVYANSVITQNGGKFQAGNSPGKATFGSFAFGPGGVNNYVFAINDAAGTAGPSPDARGHVSGWGLVQAIRDTAGQTGLPGDFTWTATPAAKLTVALETLLNPTTVGVDLAGPMDHFDPTRAFVWPSVEWAGSYAGPADAAALDAATAFDTSGFVNPVAGSFGWQLDAGRHALSLTYTPAAVPEPGTFMLAGLAAIGWMRFRPRRRALGRPIFPPACPVFLMLLAYRNSEDPPVVPGTRVGTARLPRPASTDVKSKPAFAGLRKSG
jgi:autotransporter-associated beta strand protein